MFSVGGYLVYSGYKITMALNLLMKKYSQADTSIWAATRELTYLCSRLITFNNSLSMALSYFRLSYFIVKYVEKQMSCFEVVKYYCC